MRQSIATIDSPEFINLQPLDINPLMSSCEIKVLYVGENRNRSYITKEVASDMAKTLRGAPIVGYYKEEKEDFADHGDRVIFDDEGVKFECMTRPYGFVAPDARVWFQKFEEEDDFGNTITREYLMTTGYLWTGQYEECQSVISNGKGQSMELDPETLDGHWSTDTKSGMEFFIINDAIFSKLCILGDDVEPCFEGASVTAPEVSSSFTKVDDTFRKTLYTMMQELKFALEGGLNMNNDNQEVIADSVENEVVDTAAEVVEEEATVVETEEVVAEEVVVDEENKDNNEEVAAEEEPVNDENQNSTEASPEDSFAKKEEEDKEEDETSDQDNAQEDSQEEEKDDEEDEEKKKKDYALLEEELSELQEKYSALEADYQALVEFKKAIEDEKKDALINSFYMLSDEDKAEVIENKAKYSLEDIEAKLSIICVRKKVNFDLEDTSKNDKEVEEENENAVTTYALNEQADSVPAFISALRKTQNDRKN